MAVHMPSLAGFDLRRTFARRRGEGPAVTLWDAVLFALVVGVLALVAIGGRQTLTPLAAAPTISLDPINLPGYALRTTLRMFAAMALSLLATFVFGFWAAKSRRAEMVIIPLVDVLQSVPPLAFQGLTLAFFLSLAPGKTWGAELAAVFLVFTSQAWNMVFSFYHSCRTLPKDLRDLSTSLRLGSWKRLWTLEAPYAAPQLIWNAMISMSGSWFFVVANEAFDVGATHIALPGVGSYVAVAVMQKNLHAIGYALLTMLAVILIYDQLLFRPLVAWSEKFRAEGAGDATPARSWALDFLQRAGAARQVLRPMGAFLSSLASVRVGRPIALAPRPANPKAERYVDWAWFAVLGALGLLAAWRAFSFLAEGLAAPEVLRVVVLGAISLVRVMVLVLIASVIWLPIGVWIGLRPKWAAAVQPIAQFLAAFPSILFFPLVVVGIVRFHLVPDIWLSPLMILGTQWYILFNVVAGASAFPADLLEAASSMRVKGWVWWRKVILPGIFPAYVTGAITAVGGSWNASVVAEVASWGQTKIEAHGLGAYIADADLHADLRRVLLGTVVMAVYVVLLNRLFWEPVFAWGARRLRAE